MRLARTAILLSAFIGTIPTVSWATEPLSDEQLDELAAGDFSVSVGDGANGTPTVNFGFQTGGTSGNGSVLITPSPGSSTQVTGGVSFSNTAIHVDNMIFNMNICVQCHATTLTQGNLGVPIQIKVVP